MTRNLTNSANLGSRQSPRDLAARELREARAAGPALAHIIRAVGTIYGEALAEALRRTTDPIVDAFDGAASLLQEALDLEGDRLAAVQDNNTAQHNEVLAVLREATRSEQRRPARSRSAWLPQALRILELDEEPF